MIAEYDLFQLMANSVILSGSGGQLEKEAVRGGCKGGGAGGHKGRVAGGQGAQGQSVGGVGDDTSSVSESSSNQANKKGNSKGSFD